MKKQTYFGRETARAVQNFNITGVPVDLRFIRAVALIKVCATRANCELGLIDCTRTQAIVQAAEEVIAGQLDDQFVTDAIQGGAGTSLHMNVNEVIAARANEILNHTLVVHPLDHVNLSQSTNDVVPTALKVVFIEELAKYCSILNNLLSSFEQKATAFGQVLKVGRTHLQDAVPMTLGQEFNAYAEYVKRDVQRLMEIKKYLLVTNLGGTAIGTSLNGSAQFTILVNHFLSVSTGQDFGPANDLIDATQNIDVFLHLASLLHISAVGISKICSDLRLLASGPFAGMAEILLPEYQKGSTIMPGKVNPVILEMQNQIAFQVTGNVQVASLVAYHGQLELNVMLPVLAKTVIESLDILQHGVGKLIECIDATQANPERCQEMYTHSFAMATALTTKIGYDKTTQLIKQALQKKTSLIDELENERILSCEEIQELFSLQHLIPTLNG